jgi:hypothetical protein
MDRADAGELDAARARPPDGGAQAVSEDSAGHVEGEPTGADTDDTTDPAPSTAQNTQDARASSLVSSGPAVGRRLTREEYFNSLESTLGVELDPDRYPLPREARVPAGFRNSAADMLLTRNHVAAYVSIARTVVAALEPETLVPTHGGCSDATRACFESFVDGIGTLLLRRPPAGEERASYVGLFDDVTAGTMTLTDAAETVTRVMLASPRFVYRLEYQDGAGEFREVDAYELATRLSFLIWNAAPDAELLELAAAGELEAELPAQVERLLDHPRAQRALRQYLEQWLHLDSIPSTGPLSREMKEETYRLVAWLVWEQDADLMRMFDEPRTEISGALARHYGLPADGLDDDELALFDLSGVPERAGLLSHAGVLMAHTINPATSLIDRGLFVLFDVFCDGVPSPSGVELRAAIEENMIPTESGLSQRERFAMQREDPTCMACHGKFDPLGEPFEVFGAFGEHITEDQYGNLLAGDGHVLLGDVDTAFEDFSGYARALAASESVSRCMVTRSIQHAWGRALSAGDFPMRDQVHQSFREQGGSYRALLRAIALHDAFRRVEVAP